MTDSPQAIREDMDKLTERVDNDDLLGNDEEIDTLRDLVERALFLLGEVN